MEGDDIVYFTTINKSRFTTNVSPSITCWCKGKLMWEETYIYICSITFAHISCITFVNYEDKSSYNSWFTDIKVFCSLYDHIIHKDCTELKCWSMDGLDAIFVDGHRENYISLRLLLLEVIINTHLLVYDMILFHGFNHVKNWQ